MQTHAASVWWSPILWQQCPVIKWYANPVLVTVLANWLFSVSEEACKALSLPRQRFLYFLNLSVWTLCSTLRITHIRIVKRSCALLLLGIYESRLWLTKRALVYNHQWESVLQCWLSLRCVRYVAYTVFRLSFGLCVCVRVSTFGREPLARSRCHQHRWRHSARTDSDVSYPGPMTSAFVASGRV